MSDIRDTDKFLVNRDNSSYHIEAQNLMAEVRDTDLLLVNRDGKSYKATGKEIKDSLGGSSAGIAKPYILAPQNGAGDVSGPETDPIDTVTEGGGNTTLTFTGDKDLTEFSVNDEVFQSDLDALSRVVSVDAGTNQMVVAGGNTGTRGLYVTGDNWAQQTTSRSYDKLTFAFWFHAKGSMTFRCLNNAVGGYLRLRTDVATDNIFVYDFKTNVQQGRTSAELVPNTWNHFAFQADDTGTTIFVNGVQVSSKISNAKAENFSTPDGVTDYLVLANANEKVGFGEVYMVYGQILPPSTFITGTGGSAQSKPAVDVKAAIGNFSPDGFYMPFRSIDEENPYRNFAGNRNTLDNFGSGERHPLPYDGIGDLGSFTLWKTGETVLGEQVETPGPDPADLIFIGTTPSGVGISTWGNATWEVSTDSSFGSAMIATKAITPGTEQTLEPGERGAISLEGDTQYYARLKYDSTVAPAVSEYSNVVSFITTEETFDTNKTRPGTLMTAGNAMSEGALHEVDLTSSKVRCIACSIGITNAIALGVDDQLYFANKPGGNSGDPFSALELADQQPSFVGNSIMLENGIMFYTWSDHTVVKTPASSTYGGAIATYEFTGIPADHVISAIQPSACLIAYSDSGDMYAYGLSGTYANQTWDMDNSVGLKKIFVHSFSYQGYGLGLDEELYDIELNQHISQNNLQTKVTSVTKNATHAGTKWKVIAKSDEGGNATDNFAVAGIKKDGTFAMINTSNYCTAGLESNFPAGELAQDITFSKEYIIMTTQSGKMYIGGQLQAGGSIPGSTPPHNHTTWGELTVPHEVGKINREQAGNIGIIVPD